MTREVTNHSDGPLDVMFDGHGHALPPGTTRWSEALALKALAQHPDDVTLALTPGPDPVQESEPVPAKPRKPVPPPAAAHVPTPTPGARKAAERAAPVPAAKPKAGKKK